MWRSKGDSREDVGLEWTEILGKFPHSLVQSAITAVMEALEEAPMMACLESKRCQVFVASCE